MRLNCIYEIYLFDNFKIPIKIDAAIIPIDFNIFFCDFTLKKYIKSENMEIILPDNFDNLNLDINLLIIIPFQVKDIKLNIKNKLMEGIQGIKWLKK